MHCKIHLHYNNALVKCQYKINYFVKMIVEFQ